MLAEHDLATRHVDAIHANRAEFQSCLRSCNGAVNLKTGKNWLPRAASLAVQALRGQECWR